MCNDITESIYHDQINKLLKIRTPALIIDAEHPEDAFETDAYMAGQKGGIELLPL